MCKKYDRYNHQVQDKKFFMNVLNEIGIGYNYTGYYYTIDILDILINQDVKIKSFSKQVYPIIAKKYNKSECTIERNIRNMIDKTWSEKTRRKLKDFWHSDKKPPCRQFIFCIRDYILRTINV